jgi:hypothetical protein
VYFLLGDKERGDGEKDNLGSYVKIGSLILEVGKEEILSKGQQTLRSGLVEKCFIFLEL